MAKKSPTKSPSKRLKRVVPALKSASPQKPLLPKPEVEPDGRCRCAWSTIYTGASHADYIAYHDTEWGVPTMDDRRLLEYIILDGAQCGLSWSTILAKRKAYTAAFHNWDIEKIARMQEQDVQRLLQEGSGIVRNRGKIESAINNAQIALEIQKEHGSLASYLWEMMPDKKRIVNNWRVMKDVPCTTDLAKTISASLKKRGFKFVGPTMVYAFMQAAGFVNDHTTDCFRYKEVNKVALKAPGWS